LHHSLQGSPLPPPGLNDYGIEHFFEIYDGDHISAVPDRIENQVLPFFAKNLSFEH
jgi:S-formylglutathione hydrolase